MPTERKMQSTAVSRQENYYISMAYRRRTFFGQSGALENVGLRERESGPTGVSEVRSFSQRSPQILGIFAARVSGREICLRAEWRTTRYSKQRYGDDRVPEGTNTIGFQLSTYRGTDLLASALESIASHFSKAVFQVVHRIHGGLPGNSAFCLSCHSGGPCR